VEMDKSFGKKLIGNIEGAKVEEVRLFFIWRNLEKIPILSERYFLWNFCN
jgi:hypothetical protein